MSRGEVCRSFTAFVPVLNCRVGPGPVHYKNGLNVSEYYSKYNTTQQRINRLHTMTKINAPIIIILLHTPWHTTVTIQHNNMQFKCEQFSLLI